MNGSVEVEKNLVMVSMKAVNDLGNLREEDLKDFPLIGDVIELQGIIGKGGQPFQGVVTKVEYPIYDPASIISLTVVGYRKTRYIDVSIPTSDGSSQELKTGTWTVVFLAGGDRNISKPKILFSPLRDWAADQRKPRICGNCGSCAEWTCMYYLTQNTGKTYRPVHKAVIPFPGDSCCIGSARKPTWSIDGVSLDDISEGSYVEYIQILGKLQRLGWYTRDKTTGAISPTARMGIIKNITLSSEYEENNRMSDSENYCVKMKYIIGCPGKLISRDPSKFL
jgi:hypothetical protein